LRQKLLVYLSLAKKYKKIVFPLVIFEFVSIVIIFRF